jgi:ribonuclease D
MILMTNVSQGEKPVYFIDTDAAYDRCLQDLGNRESIAFDLEFDNNMRAYGVTLCLMQVATTDASYIIDPFVPIDLRSLYNLFEDPRIEKIVHSPGEDLRLLHSLGCYPKNLFDTQVVAILLNDEHTSLAAQLRQWLGYSISKGQQRSDWRRRPLKEEQINYAAGDVAWLHALKEQLVAAAIQKQLIDFIAEEQAALSEKIYKQEVKTNFLKPADAWAMSPWDQYILNGLFTYRDGLAKKLNKPPFQVMDETIVRDLATGILDSYDLADAKGVHHSLKNDHFAGELADRMKQLQAAAAGLGLSKVLPGRKNFTAAEHAAREKANKARIQKFGPIQEVLVEQYGTFAARYMLSNALVNELLLHNTRLSELKPYRQSLIRTIAGKSGIDLGEYE